MLLQRRCSLKIVCALPFVVKWTIIVLLLGFAAGFYLGLSAASTGTGTPGWVIDRSMSLRHLSVQVQKLGLDTEPFPTSQESMIMP